MNISTIDRLLKAERMPHARVTNGFKPNWDLIPHKGMTAMTQDEIIAQIRELAKKEAVAITDKDKEAIEKRKQELFTMYESYAAPDRKALFGEALETMKRNGGHFLQKAANTAERKDVFDFIAERDNARIGIDTSGDNDVFVSRVRGAKVEHTYPLPSGGSVKASSATGRGIHLDIYQGDRQVLSVDKDGKVKHNPTREEERLRNEITDFYNALRRNADAPPPSRALDTKA
jgi:hypothetical protein